MISIRRTSAIALRQYYLMRGSISRVLPLFAWVAIDVVLWGYITKYLNSVTQSGPNFVTTLLGAVLLWDFLTRVMQGVTTAFLEDVWSRNFLNLFASPLSIAEYLSGMVLTSIITSAIGLVGLIGLAWWCFGLSFFSYGVFIIPFLLILFIFGISLGILADAMVLRLGPAAEWFVWPIPALVSPFVGVFYPLSTLPHWMQWVGRALPPSYVFEGMRSIASGHAASMQTIFIGAGLAVLHFILACFLFRRIYWQAVGSGLIARYSAESVS